MPFKPFTPEIGRLSDQPNDAVPANAVNRPLSEQEFAIAEWVLTHSNPPALSFIPQLKVARVTGHCGCGCPSVDLSMPVGTRRAEERNGPIGDTLGEVNGKTVGVMLFHTDGLLTLLEIYDMDDIEHPYGLPSVESLRPFTPVKE